MRRLRESPLILILITGTGLWAQPAAHATEFKDERGHKIRLRDKRLEWVTDSGKIHRSWLLPVSLGSEPVVRRPTAQEALELKSTPRDWIVTDPSSARSYLLDVSTGAIQILK